VVVFDLSRIDHAEVHAALQAASRVGAHLIALASVPDSVDEHCIVNAGGIYRLKWADEHGLADLIEFAAQRPLASLVAVTDAR
jgi:hypothetical protein